MCTLVLVLQVHLKRIYMWLLRCVSICVYYNSFFLPDHTNLFYFITLVAHKFELKMKTKTLLEPCARFPVRVMVKDTQMGLCYSFLIEHFPHRFIREVNRKYEPTEAGIEYIEKNYKKELREISQKSKRCRRENGKTSIDIDDIIYCRTGKKLEKFKPPGKTVHIEVVIKEDLSFEIPEFPVEYFTKHGLLNKAGIIHLNERYGEIIKSLYEDKHSPFLTDDEGRSFVPFYIKFL